jgi:hypothetical protein
MKAKHVEKVRANRSSTTVNKQPQTTAEKPKTRTVRLSLPAALVERIDQEAVHSGRSREETISFTVQERYLDIFLNAKSMEQYGTPAASPPTLASANKLGWTAAQLAEYRRLDLPKRIKFCDDFGRWTRNAAALAAGRVRRRGLTFLAEKSERDAARMRKTLAAENFAEAAYEQVQHDRRESELGELRREWDGLEMALLDGASLPALRLWFE